MIQRVLILGYVWPEPRSSAAGSRMMQIIHEGLKAGWQITFASAAQLSIHRADLNALGVSELVVELNADSFNEQVRQLNPDVVIFDRFFTEEQFSWRVAAVCPDALRILDTEDLHSLRQYRETWLKQINKAGNNERERHQLCVAPVDHAALEEDYLESDSLIRELGAIYRSDLSLVISQAEIALLTNHLQVPTQLLHYCPLLINDAAAKPNCFSERSGFMSIGNFRHQPNWDAVLTLKHHLWPLIRTRLPEANLFIYGAYPPPKATALHNPKQGFYIEGWIDDASKAISQAKVCLAPLRFGAGIKGKLVEAMVLGTPSVTTTIGAEGMQFDKHWPGAISDNADDFVNHAVALYQEPSRWQAASVQGINHAEHLFNRKNHAPQLIQAIETAFTERVSRRRVNLVGTMLRHHLHRSHQYMSQWIAAKNRVGS